MPNRRSRELGSWPTWDGKDFDSRPAEKNTLAPPCLNRASLRRDVPWGGAVAADDEAASLAERNEYGSDDGRTEPRDMGMQEVSWTNMATERVKVTLEKLQNLAFT
ncbi:hypothetical protein Cob_v008054 [Colletotrichum orbiculare MAFF 240422]|uniref:Uncharacterized protein n=1 Tax=Colletotrichum orbiculare (strain 104-T / ATCC 96160 / CBS 514.97 / LARS 414 / MAFF 240422) TaxID=1213857 RepID=A0A484FM56_COLOR|nr:hypothetical protein Cob_v008054 [Colletotrichum orbiculare MAFF 240422]